MERFIPHWILPISDSPTRQSRFTLVQRMMAPLIISLPRVLSSPSTAERGNWPGSNASGEETAWHCTRLPATVFSDPICRLGIAMPQRLPHWILPISDSPTRQSRFTLVQRMMAPLINPASRRYDTLGMESGEANLDPHGAFHLVSAAIQDRPSAMPQRLPHWILPISDSPTRQSRFTLVQRMMAVSSGAASVAWLMVVWV
jgi:hypothetical protein